MLKAGASESPLLQKLAEKAFKTCATRGEREVNRVLVSRQVDESKRLAVEGEIAEQLLLFSQKEKPACTLDTELGDHAGVHVLGGATLQLLQ